MRKKLEAEVEEDIKLDAASTFGSILWRNNSGAGTDETTGRPVRFGLGNDSAAKNKKIKSSDRIGFTPLTITPAMVGKTIAVLTSIEVKKEDWKYTGTEREIAQKEWCDLVKSHGGIAGFANSIDSYRQIVQEFLFNLGNRSN